MGKEDQKAMMEVMVPAGDAARACVSLMGMLAAHRAKGGGRGRMEGMGGGGEGGRDDSEEVADLKVRLREAVANANANSLKLSVMADEARTAVDMARKEAEFGSQVHMLSSSLSSSLPLPSLLTFYLPDLSPLPILTLPCPPVAPQSQPNPKQPIPKPPTDHSGSRVSSRGANQSTRSSACRRQGQQGECSAAASGSARNLGGDDDAPLLDMRDDDAPPRDGLR